MIQDPREIIDTIANKQGETVRKKILPRATESEGSAARAPRQQFTISKTQQHFKVEAFNHSAIQQIWTWLEKMRVSSCGTCRFSLRTRDFAFTIRRTSTRAKDIAYLFSKTFPRAEKRVHDKAYGSHLTYGHCILAEKYVKV